VARVLFETKNVSCVYHTDMSLSSSHSTDLSSRNAAIALGLSLPGDTVLYLLLPMYAAQFNVTLAEVGLLLAAKARIKLHNPAVALAPDVEPVQTTN
jgi:hypothetical protein